MYVVGKMLNAWKAVANVYMGITAILIIHVSPFQVVSGAFYYCETAKQAAGQLRTGVFP